MEGIMQADKKQITRARDVMQKEIIFIDGMATAQEAVTLMRAENRRCLVVQKRNEDDAWGIVVVKDLVKGVLLTERTPAEVNIYEIMKKPVITVPVDMDIRYVARMLFHVGIRRAPVEEKGELVGMISLASLVLDNELF
jgi:CBS domain-containing protein